MFGRQPIVDGENRHVQLPRHLGAEGRVRVEVAEHEAAAMEEEEERTGPAFLPRIVEAQGNLAARAGAGEIADDRKLADRRIRDVARRQHHHPRLVGADLMASRPGQGVQIVEEQAHVGTDEG